MTNEDTIIEARRKIGDLIEYNGLTFETIWGEMYRTYGIDLTDKYTPNTWNSILIILNNWSKGIIHTVN